MATTIDTTSPYISNYAANQLTNVDKLSTTSAVDKLSSESKDSTISDGLQIYERELAQSIANFSSGIALANIAQDGLNQQRDMLSEIKQITIQAEDYQLTDSERQAFANEIEKILQGYESIADSTSYKGELLLKTEGDSSDDLSVVAEEKIVSIYKSDTTSISDSLRTFLGEFPINPESRENMMNVLNQGISELGTFASNLKEAADSLETMVKNQLTGASNTEDVKPKLANINYGQEVTDFNKTNLLSQMGYLMQTQANAHTQRTVEVLK